MREIKFRAWLKNKNKMVLSDNTCGGLRDFFDEIRLEHNGFGGMYLMQFTGLKDKNGKEIWEGDIVKMLDDWIDHYTLYSNHQIEFGSGTFRLENGVPLSDCLNESNDFELCNFKVIGNIYENPELLN